MNTTAARWLFVSTLVSMTCVTTGAAMAQTQDPVEYFAQSCKNCHTIGGGRLTGPDLKDVEDRQKREWLIAFMMNPPEVIASGDPYALQILKESKDFKMTVPPGLTEVLAGKLLDMIAAESKLPESQFKGGVVSERPFTDEDRKQGRAIFLGRRKLKHGGVACISCHAMPDMPEEELPMPALGGGQLGPDLTNVFERYDNRKTLSGWLSGPSTGTMRAIFMDRGIEEHQKNSMTSEEIDALVAYFEVASSKSPVEPAVSRVAFLLMGLLGAAGLVFAFDAVWIGRFRSVRRTLVDAVNARITGSSQTQ